MKKSDPNDDIPEDLAEQLAKELNNTAKHNPDTGASQHYCPSCGLYYPATSTAHEGH